MGTRRAPLYPRRPMPHTAREPSPLAAVHFRSLEDPEGFLSYEVYQDQAAMDFHMSASHLAAYRKKRQDLGLVEGPPDIQVLRS